MQPVVRTGIPEHRGSVGVDTVSTGALDRDVFSRYLCSTVHQNSQYSPLMDQQVCYVLPPSSCVVPSSLRCSGSGDQVLPIFKRGWRRRVSVSVFEGGGLVVLFLWISSGPNFPHSFLHFYRFLVLITLLSFYYCFTRCWSQGRAHCVFCGGCNNYMFLV